MDRSDANPTLPATWRKPSSPLAHWALASLPTAATAILLWTLLGDGDATYQTFKSLRGEHPAFGRAAWLVSDLGNIAFYAWFAFLYLRARRSGDRRLRRMVLVYALIQVAVAFFCVRFLKIFIGRPRPETDAGFAPFSFYSRNNSLPSGHTTEVVGSTGTLALWHGRALPSLLLGIAAALVAASRVCVGYHHPSDLFFGWMLGNLTCWGVFAFAMHGTRRPATEDADRKTAN